MTKKLEPNQLSYGKPIQCPKCWKEIVCDCGERITTKTSMKAMSSKGGLALASKITPEQRKEWSARGGRKRKGWTKKKPETKPKQERFEAKDGTIWTRETIVEDLDKL